MTKNDTDQQNPKPQVKATTPDSSSSETISESNDSISEDKNRKIILSKEFNEGLAKNLVYSQTIFNKIKLREWTESQDSTPSQKPLKKLPLRGNIMTKSPIPQSRHKSCKHAVSQKVFKLQKDHKHKRLYMKDATWMPIFNSQIHFNPIVKNVHRNGPVWKKLLK